MTLDPGSGILLTLDPGWKNLDQHCYLLYRTCSHDREYRILYMVVKLETVAGELSQHLISSFKYLGPHFHSLTAGLGIVNMSMHGNNGESLELRMHLFFFHTRKHQGSSKLPDFSMVTMRLHLMVQS